MKFAAASLALVSAAVAVSDSISYEIDTVTNTHSTEVTITSCADNKCTTTVQSVTTSVVTATVDGVKTVYTTVCPLTETPSVVASVAPSTIAAVAVVSSAPVAPSSAPAPVAPSAAPSSDDEITYVDITSTPTVTASTGIESTVYKQSTFTSVYHNNSTSAAPTVQYSNDAPRNLVAGAAGLAGIAALLM